MYVYWRREWQSTLVILAWRISWAEEPSGLQSTGSQRIGHNWACTCPHTHTCAIFDVSFFLVPQGKIFSFTRSCWHVPCFICYSLSMPITISIYKSFDRSSFPFLPNCSYQGHQSSDCWWPSGVQFICFIFACAFWYCLGTKEPSWSWRVMPRFSFKNSVVLVLTFRYYTRHLLRGVLYRIRRVWRNGL